MDTGLSQSGEAVQERVISLEKKVQQQDDEIICLKSALSDALRRLNLLESTKTNNLLPSKPTIKMSNARPAGDGPLTSRQSPLVSNSSSKSSSGDAPRQSSPTPARAATHRGAASPQGPGQAMKKWGSVPSTNAGDKSNGTANASNSPRSSNSEISEGSTHNDASAEISDQNASSKISPHDIVMTSPSATTEKSQDRRSGSVGNLPQTRTNPASARQTRQKEHSYNQAEACLKFYLRGRALNFYAPTALGQNFLTSEASSPPKSKLSLEWVYGYRGRDARSNIYLLPTGEIVYFIAAVAVLYNPDEQTQRHYIGHTDDIKCIAVHPDKVTIATGQVAGHDRSEGKTTQIQSNASKGAHPIKHALSDAMSAADKKAQKDSKFKPHIRIWNSISLATLKIIGIGEFDRAVSCVAFSKMDGGQFMVAVDEANEHILSVWEWQKGEKGHKVAESKSSTEPVLAVEYHPCEANSIVSCGKSQLCFWTIEGTTLSRKLGIFEKYEKPKYVTCFAFSENGDVISGDSNGAVLIWTRGTNKVVHGVTGAHEGGVFSICTLKDGFIVTGGKDRRIVKWDSAYKKTGEEFEIPDVYGPVRMLSQGRGNLLLVGTTKNCILQGSFDMKTFSPVVQGHMDELWGLAVLPSQSQFLTVSYDKTLILWDTLTHTSVWSKELPEGGHSLCVHPEGQLVVVGTTTARWYVLDLTTHEIVTSHSDATEQIECVEFSPDARFLACGSRDNNIYIYAVSDGGRKYSKVGKCTGHSSFITHLDWSVDGQYIQSNSGDYELLYWNSSNCRQITSPSSMRDVEWATQNCTLSFPVAGIWPEGADGTDVNAVTRSNKQHLAASADDFGYVNLYNYPCSQPKSASHSYLGHSSHVTNVQFLYDDSRLVSTGGKDTAVMQWQVIEGHNA